MADKTGISWTSATWNPIRGCTKVSEGCHNCYAMGVATRFSGPGLSYEGLAKTVNGAPEWTNIVREIPARLEDPIRWRRGRMIFTNSMSDLFHEQVTTAYLARVFAVMAVANNHTYQVLTKRPERMRAVMSDDRFVAMVEAAMAEWSHADLPDWPLPHAWMGVSGEDQATVDQRVPILMETPVAVRFLSLEPQLGPVDLSAHVSGDPRLDWVIQGGESGTRHRPFDADWARVVRDLCDATGVAYWFKQHGGLTATSGGDFLLGRRYQEFPQVTRPGIERRS